MFQVSVGPKPEWTTEILPSVQEIDEAEKIARTRVLAAKERGESLIAHIFSYEALVVVSGFATADLADQINHPNYTLL